MFKTQILTIPVGKTHVQITNRRGSCTVRINITKGTWREYTNKARLSYTVQYCTVYMYVFNYKKIMLMIVMYSACYGRPGKCAKWTKKTPNFSVR